LQFLVLVVRVVGGELVATGGAGVVALQPWFKATSMEDVLARHLEDLGALFCLFKLFLAYTALLLAALELQGFQSG